MKNLSTAFLPALFYLLALPLFGQNPTFQKTFTHPTNDAGRSVTELSDGYLIAGGTDISDTTYSDALLIRTDLSGNVLWQKTYGSYGYDQLYFAQAANDGGLIALGYTSSAGAGHENAWLVKLDDDGNIIWQKTLGQAGHSTYPNNLIALPDGYILSGARFTDIAPKTRGIVVRVDNNGEVIWSKMPYTNRYNNFSMQFVKDGLIYGCGNGYVGQFGERVEGFWLSMDLNTGEVVQSFNYFSQEREELASIRPTDDGNFIMSGSTEPYSLLVTQPAYAWVQKVRPDGSVIWAKTYRIQPWLYNWTQLETDSDGGFLVNMFLYFKLSDFYYAPGADATLMKIDADGQYVWNKSYGALEFNSFSQMRKASDGGWLAVGNTSSGFSAQNELLVVKTDSVGVLETCCTPHWQAPIVTDFVDTVMNYEPVPINFAGTEPTTEMTMGTLAFSSADACRNPQVLVQDTLRFCPGQSVSLGGNVYDHPGTVELILPAFGVGCDTLATYVLEFLPQPTLNETIQFCPGQSVSLGGNVYDQPGTVELTLPASGDGCDTLATYVLEFLPEPTLNETIQFCPGQSVSLGGNVYDQPGTVELTLPASGAGCDTLAKYVLEFLPQPTLNETIRFCPGESVSLDGTVYSQPATVVLNLPSSNGGCDTLATYTLEYANENQPNTLSLSCPANISAIAATGASSQNVTYDSPTTASECPCPGLNATLVSGLASGAAFPVGLSTVCYRADDACGHSATCCFTVGVEGEDPCDVKTAGCVKFELLGISRDAALNWSYRIRITNNCAAELSYAYIQVPLGINAFSPADNGIYMAPSGRKYRTRNPNYSPMYSVRFKPLAASISAGQSDVFRYVLPQQADVDYINVGVRLSSGAYLESHLNTFNCPVVTDNSPRPAEERSTPAGWRIFPNPVSSGSVLTIDGPVMERGNFMLRDLTGRLVLDSPVLENQVVLENAQLPAGIYVYRLFENGELVGSGKLVVTR